MKWPARSRVFLLLPALLAVLSAVDCRDSTNAPCHGVSYPSRNDASVTIPQGIWGDVWVWEGNFMPVCPSGTVTAVQREVRIYALTTFSMCDTVYGGGFFNGPNSQLIATSNSNARGFFQIPLDPGRYTICVVEGDRLYSNFFGSDMEIGPFEVLPDSVTSLRFDINNGVVY